MRPAICRTCRTRCCRWSKAAPSRAGWIVPGGVFLRRADLMPPEDRTLLEAAARVVMDGADGNLREQLKRPQIPFGPEPGQIPEFTAAAARRRRRSARRARRARTSSRCSTASAGLPTTGANTSSPSIRTPARCRPSPGRTSSRIRRSGLPRPRAGPGYTWSRNSHDNRLTPWRNDPVSDPPGEAVFIRDEETGAVLVRDAASGRRRPAVHASGMARAIRRSSTRGTGSPRRCCCSCRRPTRSRSST